MNEKIYKLAEQAGITFTDYGSGEFLDKDDIDMRSLAKFAELIVRECADYAEYLDLPGYKANMLKKHFGVE